MVTTILDAPGSRRWRVCGKLFGASFLRHLWSGRVVIARNFEEPLFPVERAGLAERLFAGSVFPKDGGAQARAEQARRLILETDFAGNCGPLIIAYSLFGNEPRYARGIIRNISLAEKLYPGWKVAVFHDSTVPDETVKEIRAKGAATYRLDPGFPVIAHRFLPAGDPGIERLIVRDADSDLGAREDQA